MTSLKNLLKTAHFSAASVQASIVHSLTIIFRRPTYAKADRVTNLGDLLNAPSVKQYAVFRKTSGLSLSIAISNFAWTYSF